MYVRICGVATMNGLVKPGFLFRGDIFYSWCLKHFDKSLGSDQQDSSLESDYVCKRTYFLNLALTKQNYRKNTRSSVAFFWADFHLG